MPPPRVGSAIIEELRDPYCLHAGEAGKLLAGHPWRRFVVIGDSVAEGVVEPVPGYRQQAWADRVAAELTATCPELVYRNLGRRDLRARQVRETQLAEAIRLGPDLALVTCGGIDAFLATYDPDAVDRELATMIIALQAAGADVITLGQFDISHSPALAEWARPGVRKRYATLVEHVAALSERLGTIHIDLFGHPVNDDPSTYSADGRHGNARSHAIAAAEAIRRLSKAARIHNV